MKTIFDKQTIANHRGSLTFRTKQFTATVIVIHLLK